MNLAIAKSADTVFLLCYILYKFHQFHGIGTSDDWISMSNLGELINTIPYLAQILGIVYGPNNSPSRTLVQPIQRRHVVLI